MWSAIRWLVLRIAAIRWLFKLGGLALLLPIAALLKVVGLPILLILGVIGFPVLILLFLFGLPIFAVLLVGGAIMGLMGMVLMIGVAALRFAVLVVLPLWLMWKVASWLACSVFGRRKRGNGDTGDTGGSTTTTEPVDPIDLGTPPDAGIDPAI